MLPIARATHHISSVHNSTIDALVRPHVVKVYEVQYQNSLANWLFLQVPPDQHNASIEENRKLEEALGRSSLHYFAQQIFSVTLASNSAVVLWENVVNQLNSVPREDFPDISLLHTFAQYKLRRANILYKESIEPTNDPFYDLRAARQSSMFSPLPLVVLSLSRLMSHVDKCNFQEVEAEVEVILRRRMEGTGHEFLLVRCKTRVLGNATAREFWMRIDRNAKANANLISGRSLFLAAFPSHDTVCSLLSYTYLTAIVSFDQLPSYSSVR